MKSAFLVTVDPNSQDGTVDLGYDHQFTEIRRTPIATDVPQSLIDAITELPPGGGDLCFDPVFVVELRDGDDVQWSGATCFDCGTFYSTDGLGPDGGIFDQTPDAAKRLLGRMRDLA